MFVVIIVPILSSSLTMFITAFKNDSAICPSPAPPLYQLHETLAHDPSEGIRENISIKVQIESERKTKKDHGGSSSLWTLHHNGHVKKGQHIITGCWI